VKFAGWNETPQRGAIERKRKLDEKNIEFDAMNEDLFTLSQQIQDYNATVIQLAIAEERNRLAHDLHDSIGQLMTLSISQLTNCGNLCLESPLEAKAKLDTISELLREGLAEIRQSITELIPEKLKEYNLMEALGNLIMDYESSGLNVDFSVEGTVKTLELPITNAVYRSCQEALTNALKHGHASQVMILLRFSNDSLQVFISDDGSGCEIIQKGLGLIGMEQRIKSLKGNIKFGSDGESGFNVRITIPLINRLPVVTSGMTPGVFQKLSIIHR
jgi:signal transduction histidine kinase